MVKGLKHCVQKKKDLYKLYLYKLYLYKLYQYNPKRLCEQRELAETYVITGHMGELSGGFVNERRTQSENKALLTKMKNFLFVA